MKFAASVYVRVLVELGIVGWQATSLRAEDPAAGREMKPDRMPIGGESWDLRQDSEKVPVLLYPI